MNEEKQTKKRRRRTSSNKNTQENPGNNSSRPEEKKVSGTNSAQHYLAHPELLIDAGSLAFSQMLGINFHIDPTVPGSRVLPRPNAKVAGVMRLGITPTFGGSSDPNSPINVASRAIYSWVRHANSGRTNYEAPDLFIYIMAVSHLHALLAKLKRVYGTANLFSQRNRYFPRTLVQAQGVNYDDLIKNLAAYRMQINNLSLKLGTLAVPATMPIVPHLVTRLSNIYLDAASDKAQAYLFDLDKIGLFDAISLDTGGILQYRTVVNGKVTANLSSYISVASSMIDAILRDEDMNIMSGDILKAYGDNILKTEIIAPDYTVVPVYDEHVLLEIENATILSTTIESSIGDKTNLLYQEDGYLKNDLRFSTKNPAVLFDKLINVHWMNPTPVDVMLATRSTLISSNAQIVYSTSTQQANITISPLSTPSELITSAYVYTNEDVFDYRPYLTTEQDNEINYNPLGLLALQSVFRRSPILGVYNFKNVGGSWIVEPIETPFMGQIDNYTIIGYETFARLNEVATLSLFNVHRIGD